MLMQDMTTGYLHEVPDSQLYEYDEVVFDGLGNLAACPLQIGVRPQVLYL